MIECSRLRINSMKYDISSKYKVTEGIYDELFTNDTQPRKTTGVILERLKELGYEETERRRKRLNYTQYYQAIIQSDNEDNNGLDSIPLFLSQDEWKSLENGLKQRAKLYNLIAKDIYGEQKLIKDGIIPPALVYANPDFLQMLWTGKDDGKCFVNLMSTDIVRDKDGKFVAVNDRFQIPEGLGNALDNRISVARAYPELFHDLTVTRLNDFFDKFRQTILTDSGEAGAVLLASEPDRNRRSEDAILARHLQLQLVENDDLSVRGFNVYLKTLTGLKKINTILRRVEDGMCDPLELRIDSGEGAVGLISAVRSGNVKVINALGTGILESPIVRAFLPAAAKYFFNENLLIEPVPSFWLGKEEDCKKVLEAPEKYMFYSAFGKKSNWIYKNMTMTAQLALIEKILQNPENYTAEEYIQTSTTPYVQNDEYKKGEAHWRFFASNTDTDCSVMPGGYGWVVSPEGKKVIDKDIWVLTDRKVKAGSEKQKFVEHIALSRAGGDLPSRAADNLFKLGRNLERAELHTRIARGAAKRLADSEFVEVEEQIPFLLKAWQDDIVTDREYEKILWNLVMKKTEETGLQPTFKAIRFFAVQLRDRMSEDTWQFIKAFGEHKLPEGRGAAALLPYLQRIISDAAAFEGLSAEGMTKGHGWRFLEIGRRIERGILTLTMLKNMLKVKNEDESGILRALLEVDDGSLTYFWRYGAKLHPAPVVDLLLCDESNPHSVAYQALRIEQTVKKLPHALNNVFFAPVDKEILKLMSQLRLVDVYALIREDDGRRKMLEAFCDERMKEFENIGEMLSREYLNHIPQKGIKTAMATEV